MNKNELNEILEKHKHWLNEDCEGCEKMNADLHYANLRGADLSNADLRGANLRGANLRGADLSNADLRYAYLRGADFNKTDLSNADLSNADLSNADLSSADLCNANLSGANLSNADLSNADLRGADLRGANLRGANLRGAKNFPYIPYSCPDTSSFIGYKKAKDGIVELEILVDARRSSATGRKCRCDKAKVLGIYDDDKNLLDIKETASKYNQDFKYIVGEIVEEPNFCEDRWKECAEGIHFFMNFKEAADYIL